MSGAPVKAVLVTGTDAPLGEWLVRSLLEDTGVGHVLAIGNRRPEEALPVTHATRLTYLQVDLLRDRAVRDMLFGPARDLGVEVVIHTAMSRSAMQEGGRIHALNVEATRSLLALCERHPTIHRFVLRSFSEVYDVQHDLPILIAEEHPLNLHAGAPQFVRDRVEADLHACVRMGLSPLQIVVLRCAEALAPGTGSQLFDYLDAPLCARPFGYDPMINVASLRDIVHALTCAMRAPAASPMEGTAPLLRGPPGPAVRDAHPRRTPVRPDVSLAVGPRGAAGAPRARPRGRPRARPGARPRPNRRAERRRWPRAG